MIRLGRNDPCYCGSGKKYKKCHLDSDQHQLARGVQESSRTEESRGAEIPSGIMQDKASIDVNKLPEMLRQLSKQATGKDRKVFTQMEEEIKPVLEYMEHHRKIEEAAWKLEDHKSDFSALVKDSARFQKLISQLFAEERFVPLRFTAADIQRAFDHVGSPGGLTPDDRAAEILRAAILHIADKPCRAKLTVALSSMLPEFVNTGRYMEALTLQSLAFQTVEYSDESNALLFHMFSYGYDSWAAQLGGCEEALLQRCGLDVERLGQMEFNEIEAMYEDPAIAAAAEAMFRANPALREKAAADVREAEMNSFKLLYREDARFLLLSQEEMEPWLRRIDEEYSRDAFMLMPDAALSETEAEKYFSEVILPFFRSMAVEIFNPDRIRRLVGDLKKYRTERFAEGDTAAVLLATGAIAYVELEDSPGENKFILNLCVNSIEATISSETL